jgi:DNA-binding GntR family transcriptional regulator
MYLPNGKQGDSSLLVKQNLAARLKEEILHGNLAPGQRIVEGYWAKHLGAAQASVREAINLLIGEGFAAKASGHSARVTSYSEADITQIYELRAVLEGYAASLVATRQPDLEPLEAAIQEMCKCAHGGDVRGVIEADLNFHLKLCELSGNRILHAQVRTLLVPLFAFVSMRAFQSHQQAQAWESDLDRHQRIIEFIREGDPATTECVMRSTIRYFAARACAIWQ